MKAIVIQGLWRLLGALIGLLLGAGLGVFLGDPIAKLFNISNFEGGRGYFVAFFILPLFALIGAILGAVWITYQLELPTASVALLKALTKAGAYRLLTPYPDLPSPIVASAWGLQLQVEEATDPRLAEFIKAYENRPDGPEYGAPCSGGVGEPEQ